MAASRTGAVVEDAVAPVGVEPSAETVPRGCDTQGSAVAIRRQHVLEEEPHLGLDRTSGVVRLQQVEALVDGRQATQLVQETDVVLVAADPAGEQFRGEDVLRRSCGHGQALAVVDDPALAPILPWQEALHTVVQPVGNEVVVARGPTRAPLVGAGTSLDGCQMASTSRVAGRAS